MKKRIIWGIFLSLFTAHHIQAQLIDENLQELIQSAFHKDHGLKIKELETKQTSLDRKRAGQTYLPNLSLNANYTRLDKDIRLSEDLQRLLKGSQALLVKEALGIPFNTPLPSQVPLNDIPPIQEKNIYKSSLDGEWVLFAGGQVLFTDKALRHKQKALEYQQTLLKKNLAEKIIDAYERLSLLKASNKVLNQTQLYLNKQKEYVEKAISNGLATDLDRQKLKLAEQELNLKKLEIKNNSDLLSLQLAQLSGISPQQIKMYEPVLKPILLKQLSSDINDRIEVKAMNEVIQAKKYQKKAELGKYIPKIAAKAHYELTDKSLTMLDPKWYVGVGIKWDFLDGFKALNKSKKIKMDAEIQQEKLFEAKELIKLEQKQAQLNYHKSLQQIEMAKQKVVLAEKTYQFSLKQYKNGLIGITDLLDSINKLEKAKMDLKKAYYAENKSVIDLLKSNEKLLDFIKTN